MPVRKGLLALVASLLIAVPAAGATAPKAKLRMLSATPVRVSGIGFHARERVGVTLVTNVVWHKVLRATKAGRFVLSFPNATLDRCSGYSVLARGAAGARASLRVMPLACAPSGRDPSG
jgi:hypothetical protein